MDYYKTYPLIASLFCFSKIVDSKSPNIILILADDYGWNDVSFHGSDQIPTPNIDALAYNGVILNSHYTAPLCTPSRSSLMTGLYAFHTGMQHDAMRPYQRKALPKGKILPEYLKDLNYRTVAIGKWHLGYYREDYLPFNRGFDSFFGYYNGYNSYYDFVVEGNLPDGQSMFGFDLRKNETPAYDFVGRYATDTFTDEAVRNIQTHNKESPLFMYMSHLAVHAGNDGKLLEVPRDIVNRFLYINDVNRRTYAAMVAKLDESVGRIVSALEEADMLHNSIVLFLSDNGAPTLGSFSNWGSNYPFRGIKNTHWEGAMRCTGLVWSPLITARGRVSNDLFHISDWLPTLYAAAGGDPSDLPELDGINQWDNIVKNSPSERQEIVLNIDDEEDVSTLRVDSPQHHWKIVVGDLQGGEHDGYYGEGNGLDHEEDPVYSLDLITSSETHKSLQKLARKYSSITVTPQILIPSLRENATVKCDYPVFNRKRCSSAENPKTICLYDIKTDPCELNDLSSDYPGIVSVLLNRINEHKQTLVPSLPMPNEENLANPVYFNGTWSPWYNLDNVPFILLQEADEGIL